MIEKKDVVVFIPGLGDDRLGFVKRAIPFWQEKGFGPQIHIMPWNDQNPLKLKLERLFQHIEDLSSTYRVNIIGTSAGGVAALYSKTKRPELVHKAINVCGRIRKGSGVGFRAFERQVSKSPSFREAVILFENLESNIPKSRRSEIMCIRPKFGLDELVPGETVFIEGANNVEVNRIEHALTINYVVGPKFAPVLMNFIRS